MKRAALFLLLALSCDPQADSSYLGEPLVTLSGQVISNGGLPQLEAAMLWQRGPPPSTDDQDLATRAPVQAGFPATFTAYLYHPPPDAARRTLAPGEPIYARANAAAVPYGVAAAGVASIPAPSVAGGSYGIDANHWVVWLDGDAREGSLTAWWLGAPLTKGFHLMRVAAVCVSAEERDACVADLSQRGVDAATASQFCTAQYRLSPAPPNELLVLDLGTVALGPPAGGCP